MSFVVRVLILTASVLLLAFATGEAAPSWANLLPSGAARGQEIDVQIRGGKFDIWPVEAWTNTTEIEVRALEEKDRLRIRVSPTCKPGIYAIRLHDKTAATSLRPFVVSAAVEMNENEPNQRLREAVLIEGTKIINGFFDGRDVDHFAVDLELGATLVASMTANEILESQVDAVLQVTTPAGFVLAQNHDWRRLDPRVVYKAKESGRHIVRCFAFPSDPNADINLHGDDTWVYRLTVTSGALVDYAYPMAVEKGKSSEVELVGWNLAPGEKDFFIASEHVVRATSFLELWRPTLATPVRVAVVPHAAMAEPRDRPVEPRAIQLPCSVTGLLAQPGERDRFTFEGKKDEHVRLELHGRRLGSPLDSRLTLIGPDGKNVQVAEDSVDREGDIQKALPADGTYTVELEDLYGAGGERYFYVLHMTYVEPGFGISTGIDQLTITAGKTATVEVAVQRDRFGEEIEVSAFGLPPGVHAEPVISKNEGDAAKKVTLTLTADEGVTTSGPFGILGRATEPSLLERRALSSKPWLSDLASYLWVTVVLASEPVPKEG